MSPSHEDIRYKVITKLIETIASTINHIEVSKPELYSRLKSQLKEYKEIIEKQEYIPIIIKNERILRGVGKPDVEVFGGRILVEVKVKESEFPSGLQQLTKYVRQYPEAEYAIVTNYEIWRFYRVENGNLKSVDRLDLRLILEEQLSKGVKMPLSTEKVRNIFSPIAILEKEFLEIFSKYREKSDALFEAYKNIMKRLYERASEDEIKSLFIKHTLMQMIVSACLTVSSGKRTSSKKACSGAEIEIEVVLPYLNWWASLISTEIEDCDNDFLNSISESIYARALLLDWKQGGQEDIFRELYEILIDAETRRKIGEYYTPLWLVEYMMEKISSSIMGKIVLDPFCGSGTFLVVAFYRKVQQGEDPDSAIREIIGFDVNPLAVSIARSELMIAYQGVKEGTATPLVFNTDSASLLLRDPGKWESISFLDELRKVEKKIEYVDSPIYASTNVDFSEVLSIEMILRQFFRESLLSEDIEQTLGMKLSKLRSEDWKGSVTRLIVETLSNNKSIESIASLIRRFGDGVWAVSITSLFAPHIIRKVKVDVVITNPPWAQLTEPKGSYGKLIRSRAKKLLRNYEKTAQIMNGSDIASVLLYGCMNIARSDIAFLMPEEVVFTTGSYYGLGKILTFSAVQEHKGEIVQVLYDAFQHGRLPSIIFLKTRKGKISCYSMKVRWKGEYSKALHLSDITCCEEKEESYHDYMKKVSTYTQASRVSIRNELVVDDVFPMGNFIRGLFGGEKKKGAKNYAGLVFSVVTEDKTAVQYSIRLSKTVSKLRIPGYFLDRYWKKLVYISDVFPFYLHKGRDVLLSSKGKEDLGKFLRTHIYERLSGLDKTKVEQLIDEIKQPDRLDFVEPNLYYVIYRRSRTFASFVLTPNLARTLSSDFKHEIIIYDDCSYMTMKAKTKAYYYSALLNSIAYEIIRRKGAFVRHQYLRPLIAISYAGLKWNGKSWQRKVATAGKWLQDEAPKCFQGFVSSGMRVDKCFSRLMVCDRTKKLFQEINEAVKQHTDEAKFQEALEFVCKMKKS